MRFAAVQIPAKIGVRSLNGEKLDVLNTFRTSSDSSPFFTLSRRRFLHAVIYKAARGTDLPGSFQIVGYDLAVGGTRFITSLPVKIDNNSDHVAWGGLYRQYFVPIDKVQKHNDAMKITRELIMSENVKVGDKVTVKITFENNQDMDFVYLKDLRGACFEPTEQLSRYHWNNGLWYYQSTSDVSMEFFFERLPKGKHTVSYDVYVTKEGSFSAGYSFIQCQYAPEFGAYSKGARIYIE